MKRGRPVKWLFQQSIELRYNGGQDGTYLTGDCDSVWDISKARNLMKDYIWSVVRTEESELAPQFLFEKLDIVRVPVTVMEKCGNEGS